MLKVHLIQFDMILVIKVIFFISVLICLLRFFGNIVKKLFILIWKYSPLFAIIIAISWALTLKNEKEQEINDLINDVLAFFESRDYNWEKEKFI